MGTDSESLSPARESFTLLSISTPWLIVSTPIPAEVSTKQKPFEPGCLQHLNRASREGWRPSWLQCRIEPASQKKCFDITIVLTSWHQIVWTKQIFAICATLPTYAYQKTSPASCQITSVASFQTLICTWQGHQLLKK